MATLNLEKDKKLLVATLRKLKSSKDLSDFIDDLLTEEVCAVFQSLVTGQGLRY